MEIGVTMEVLKRDHPGCLQYQIEVLTVSALNHLIGVQLILSLYLPVVI